MNLPLTVLGLMSGTSLDGIDVACLTTDGERAIAAGPWATYPYEPPVREAVRAVLGGVGDVAAAEAMLTAAHAAAIARFRQGEGDAAKDVALVGFHGHTILHRPREGRTWQIGDGAALARACGIDVVNDFRTADVAAGGEGAPLVPLYHAALAAGLARPLAVLNLGGVGNVSWIGADDHVLAFDTGPANAPIDDWLKRHTGTAMDKDGAVASAGTVDAGVLAGLLAHPYFRVPPPKSLDRDDFGWHAVKHLPLADGAATLTAFTAASVAAAVRHFPAPPRRWLVTGGGRHNPALMAALAAALGMAVEPVERVGWQGDALEAQAFAWLAVRSRRALPLSLPSTTGVREPLSGGRYHPAAA